MVKLIHFLLILAVTVDVNSQFFDFFTGFKPLTLRPIYEPAKSSRIRSYQTTESYHEHGRSKTTEHTTKLIRKTTKSNKQTNKKSRIDKIIEDGRNTINYDDSGSKVYTENPFERPGIKPAIVNGPPITNRPPRPYFPRPISGLDQNDDHSVTPELIVGPDEDYMTAVEKQRYIELAEKKCEQYMSLTTVRVEAIPLVPSPRPVVVNVSSCAWSIPLVVGGNVVPIQQFPHMALLGWTKVQSDGYSWKCGGSLVSERHVLTAGHCAYQERDESVIIGPPRAVQLGSSRLDDPGAIVQHVASVTRHPKYRPPQSYHDIAVVTMTSSVTFSSAIRPACMGAPPAPGDHFIATGWGKTEFGGEQSSQLRGVSLSVWSQEECSEALGTTRKLPRGPDKSQTCAGEKNGGRDTCQGDSGGPAQVLARCSWRVLAVTSAGRSCGAPGTPALYANVPLAFVAKVAYGPIEHDEPQSSDRNQNSDSNIRNSSFDKQKSNSKSQQSSYDNNRQTDYNQENSNNRHSSYDNNRQSDSNRPNSNNNDQQSSYNNENSNSNNRQSDYSHQNNNNRQSSYDNNRQSDYNQPNSNSNDRQSSYDNENNNSNNRQSDYNHQNKNNRQSSYDNNRQSDYNQPNSNSNDRQSSYNNENINSNNRQGDYSHQNNNNRQSSYDNNRQSDYNQPNRNSNDRQSSYDNENNNSNNRQSDYSHQNNNNRQSSYDNNRQSDYNQPNSNSNNRQNSYNNENSNNNRQSDYNEQNNNNRQNYYKQPSSFNQYSNSNNQQSQWNKRTTTTPKWYQDNHSYNKRWNNNYNNPYIDNTEDRYSTDQVTASRPQYYNSGLENPYSEGNIWRT